jgi:hypothetical protein
MARMHSPRLVNPALVHDRHFAGQIGIQTPVTIGQRQGELAAEKQQLTKPPVVGGSLADGEASQNLLTTLHTSGVINDQTDTGFTETPIFHDINDGNAIGASETIDVSMEVRRYNALSGPDIVVTLPLASDIPAGKLFTFHRNDESGFKVTITPVGGELIDNRATYELIGANANITIMSMQTHGWIIVSRSNGDTRFFETVPSVGTAFTDAALGANTAYLTRVHIPDPMTCFEATHALGATGGAFHADAGVYFSDGTTLTRLGSTGSQSLASVNALSSRAFTALFDVYPGFDYYVGFACDSATPTFMKCIGTAFITALRHQTIAFTSAFPLPSTLTVASGVITGNQPWVLIEGIHTTP